MFRLTAICGSGALVKRKTWTLPNVRRTGSAPTSLGLRDYTKRAAGPSPKGPGSPELTPEYEASMGDGGAASVENATVPSSRPGRNPITWKDPYGAGKKEETHFGKQAKIMGGKKRRPWS